jgi:hypothetical protein
MRVKRGEQPVWYDAAVKYNRGPNGNSYWALSKGVLDDHKVHASEYSSVGLKYDHHVDNNGTLTELYSQVNQLLDLHGAT